MTVSFKQGDLEIGHKTHMGSLNDMFRMGNVYRYALKQSQLRMEAWLSMESTKEYITLVAKQLGRDSVITKKGKGGFTQAHLYILLDAAMYLSSELKYEVIEMFVNDKLLEWRDRSGDNFIDLNAQVALSAEEVFGKPAHTGHYVQIAKNIKERVKPHNESWNSAKPLQLVERARIEEALSTCLRAGLVTDWDHLKDLSSRV